MAAPDEPLQPELVKLDGKTIRTWRRSRKA